MKPSALKNELNAILHFLKFAKMSKNLAVTDPVLRTSLDGVRDVVSMFQEGILKKINLDRNAKTTRNLQEGLPFDVEQVRRQYEDEALVTKVTWPYI